MLPRRGATATFRGALPWLLVALLLTLVPLFGQVPSWTLLVFTGCVGWRYYLERSGRSLPSMVARLCVFMPVTLLILRSSGTHPNATSLLTFLIALLSLKVLELRTPRDFTVVALLGYFMVLSAFFYSQAFGLTLYLGCIILVNSVALIRCHGGTVGNRPALRLAFGMALQALPLVVLLFVVFPRIQAGLFQHMGFGNTGQTGMSETLQPGTFSSLVQSDALVFRAKIDSTKPVDPGQLYWRGLVLDVCEHPMSWRASQTVGGATPPDKPRAPDDIKQTITLIPTGNRWLFALDRPNAMRLSANYKDMKPEYSARAQTLHSQSNFDRNLIYYAFSSLSTPEVTPLEALERRAYLHVPRGEISSRVTDLVQGWRKGGRNDEEVLRAASRFFQSNNFVYTLTPGLLTPEHALDEFLFSTRKGFCEHYAAAYSTLMRVAGIPSRVVVGYQGGEFNRLGSHYAVRQSDAHAWSEVWLEGRGWVREDPTALVAPERVNYGAENFAVLDGATDEQSRLDRLNEFNSRPWRWLVHNVSQVWDSVDEQWNLMVLGFDQDSQLTVLEKLGLGNLDWLGRTAVALTVACIILAAGAFIIHAADRAPASRLDPARRLYERFCRKLAARANLRRDPSEGPLDFARRASDVLPTRAAEIERITSLYVASRYSAKGGAATVEPLRQAVSRFEVPRAGG